MPDLMELKHNKLCFGPVFLKSIANVPKISQNLVILQHANFLGESGL